MSRKAALLFAAAALFLLGVIVPPFQNPDEPQHFAVAVFYARGASGEGAERAAVESGVLRMMDRANWWRLVGIGRPQPLPRSLSEVEFLMEGMGNSSDFRERLMNYDLWHRLAGTAMRPVAGWGLERLYYLARAASAIFLIGTFFLLWKAFEILGGLFGEGARLGFYLVFFLPQFWLMGTAVSPDAFVALLCAAFFYGAARLLAGTKEGRRGAAEKRGGMTAGRIGLAALVVFLPIVAVLTDRSAFVLVPAAILAAVLFVRRENWQTVVPWMLIGAIGAILAVYFAALRSPFLAERVYLSIKALAAGGGAASLAGILDLSGFARMFWGFTADGLLLKFGWLVFGVSKAVYWAWRILLVVAGAGLIVRLVKWAKARMSDEGGEEKAGEVGAKNGGAAGCAVEREGGEGKVIASAKEGGNDCAAGIRTRWIVLAVAVVALQAFGMWAYYGTHGILGQGRYFFPVILPGFFLLAVGLNDFGDMIKKGAGRKLVAAAIMGEFLLLVFTLWTEIVPAFHLILRGPHPGV